MLPLRSAGFTHLTNNNFNDPLRTLPWLHHSVVMLPIRRLQNVVPLLFAHFEELLRGEDHVVPPYQFPSSSRQRAFRWKEKFPLMLHLVSVETFQRREDPSVPPTSTFPSTNLPRTLASSGNLSFAPTLAAPEVERPMVVNMKTRLSVYSNAFHQPERYGSSVFRLSLV